MIIANTPLEEILKNLLQKRISFEIDKKVFKTGRVVLYSQKYFFISFILNTNKKKKEKTEVPIPFNVEIHKEDSLIYFDYRVSSLAVNNKEAFANIQDISVCKNKYLNKILTITIHED